MVADDGDVKLPYDYSTYQLYVHHYLSEWYKSRSESGAPVLYPMAPYIRLMLITDMPFDYDEVATVGEIAFRKGIWTVPQSWQDRFIMDNHLLLTQLKTYGASRINLIRSRKLPLRHFVSACFNN